MPRRSLAAVLAGLLLLSACSADTGSGVDAEPAAVPTVLILDGSGSMNQNDAPGPRMDAAKAAAHELVTAFPDDAIIGLNTYGTATGSAPSDKTASCQDVTTLVPLGPLERAGMDTAIDGIAPSGYTPISLALQSAAKQLPADDSARAIVLVSDGEETCDIPPCDTASQLKEERPGLTISTVGFKVDGPAADQLRCIADVAGGLFVQAANAKQLAARLLATQNIDEANSSLSATGIHGINLGDTVEDIRAKHRDFPDSLSGGRVVLIWRDCDFGFNDGILEYIDPHGRARTIDGIGVGYPVGAATELYGQPLSAVANRDGTIAFSYDADPGGDAAYQITVHTSGLQTGTIESIVLCRCKPQIAPSSSGPEEIVLKPVDTNGTVMPGYRKNNNDMDFPLDCSFGSPSPYDVTSGVLFCTPYAALADACWLTAGGTDVLCLTDPFEMQVTLRPATDATGALRPQSEPPHPMALELEDGTQCRARVGGAWSDQDHNPDYVGQFSCKRGASSGDFTAVWGPADASYGIRKSPDRWTVEVGLATGPLTTLVVTKAYYVGTAEAASEPQPAGCDAEAISADIGSQIVIMRCYGDWAYVTNGGMGDSTSLIQRSGSTWQRYTGFPSSFCRDEAADDGVPGPELSSFSPC